jgi:hypothetical protein
MNELEFDIEVAGRCLLANNIDDRIVIKLTAEQADHFLAALPLIIRRAYIADDKLELLSESGAASKRDILAATVPDPGAVMAGDFGEILVYVYHVASNHPVVAFGPIKWRLKLDRNKPMPYSDVVHFVLPQFPRYSENDVLLCSEVKTKSTTGSSTPIADAIRDSGRDRTGRLAKTLAWLKERAILRELGTVEPQLLDRFVKADQNPRAEKRFYAVAVLCESLADAELAAVTTDIPPDTKVIVMIVPELYATYNRVFESVHQSVVMSSDDSEEVP